MLHQTPNCIPLCLNPKFRELYPCSSRHTNLQEASQAAAGSHKYIGYWNGETEGSPIGCVAIFWRFETWNIPLAKVVDFEPLGALFGLGAPEAVLLDFVSWDVTSFSAWTAAWSKKPYNSKLKSTLIHKTRIIPWWLEHSASGCAENQCNCSLKWTQQIHETLVL